ncbi:MAG: hypothetical protein ACJAS9_000411 [Polaribacter sp.]|jgi:hypothetical protein
MPEKIQHLTNTVIMVRPIDFGFNSQTSQDNEFQHKPVKADASRIQKQALLEFNTCVETLNRAKLNILILEKNHTLNKLPDAIFPNNWFSTRHDGSLLIYPMKAPNRQDEVQIEPLCKLLTENHYNLDSVIDYRSILDTQEILEGTGSLIFHHPSQQLFAAISERCHLSAVEKFARSFNYQLTHFQTQSLNGNPIYHTNVLMSCGEDFTVITSEIIKDTDKSKVVKSLENSVSDIITISETQMTENFCGNILQLQDKNAQPVIALSASAYKGFKSQQIKQLEKHGSLIICDISTIEYVGGGSLRCMLAENFLPKQ